MAQYKRILLKLSGESLMGGKQYGIDEVRLNEYLHLPESLPRQSLLS